MGRVQGSKRRAMAALRREAWPPRYETDKVVALSLSNAITNLCGNRGPVFSAKYRCGIEVRTQETFTNEKDGLGNLQRVYMMQVF
nr:hypothetical protein [Tanacetum cinerariifolium]